VNVKLGKILTLALIGIVLLSFAAALPAFASGDGGTVLMINPLSGDGNFHFDTSTMGYGSTFEVLIKLVPNASAIPLDVYGWQVLVHYDPTLVNYTSEFLPAGHVFDGQSFSSPPPTVDYGAGTYLKAVAMTSGFVNVDVEKPMIKLTFKIIATPNVVDPLLSGTFSFLKISLVGGSYILDSVGQKMDIAFIGGDYQFSWLAPTETPYLEVTDPVDLDENITANAPNQTKNVDIYIRNCSAGWEMMSVQFELWYNTTLLNYTNSAINPGFVNGTFMESFVGTGEYGIAYMVKADYEGAPPPHGAPVGENYFFVGVMKMPDGGGEWHAPFPNGGGKLVTLKVMTLIQGLFPDVYISPLEIKNVTFYNRYGNVITPGVSRSGNVIILPKVLGRSIDIFTQYPDPFGGQGLFQNSDMFWPQKEVTLYANVSYNEWPEQLKDVAFQIIDPHGTTWAVLYARTNTNGTAETSFRLPWPCPDPLPPEYYFGQWTVIGTVDVACTIMNDTLHFKYDFLVHIVKVTTDAAQYKHLGNMAITVDFKSYRIQTYNVTVTITVEDETGVPFDFTYVLSQIGGAVYCSYKNYTETATLKVKKFARAGTASIIVGVLNDFPFNGGTVQSGPFDPITVQILAEWAD
jgi:hypothetical protein